MMDRSRTPAGPLLRSNAAVHTLQEAARTFEMRVQMFDAHDGNDVERSIAAMPADANAPRLSGSM